MAGGALDLAPLFAALLDPALDANEGSDLLHGTLVDALAASIRRGRATRPQRDCAWRRLFDQCLDRKRSPRPPARGGSETFPRAKGAMQ